MNSDWADLPDAPGTYVLLLCGDEPTTIQINRFGTISLKAGVYAYVGSARGPGGLRARVRRHMRPVKPIHWHIDTLTALMPVTKVWFEASSERLECIWARALAGLHGISTPVPGFGSSDCACRSHLFAVPAGSIHTAWEALGRPAAKP